MSMQAGTLAKSTVAMILIVAMLHALRAAGEGTPVATSAKAEASTPAVSPKPFFGHAEYGEMRISPSGRYVAALAPVHGRLTLAVLDLDDHRASTVAAVEDQDIVFAEWVNDRRLVFSFADLQAGPGEQRGGGLYAVNRDGTDFRELAPSVARQIGRGQFVGRFTVLLQLPRDGSDDILAASNESSARGVDVYRINTVSGHRELKSLDKPGDVHLWVADRKGALRAAVVVEKATLNVVYWRPDEDAKWVEVARYGLTGPRMVPVAFDGDGSLIVAANYDRDTLALYRFDPVKKATGELLAQHPYADLAGGLVFDRRKNRIVGLNYDAERPGAAWFDDEYAALQAAVDKALPGQRNVISRSEGDRALILSYSDRDPGRYYLLDLRTRRLEPFVVRRSAIKPAQMPARQVLRYPARDGLQIPAYLTLPPNREPHDLPLVVLVHGGPWVRGADWHWEAEPAFLASLGYAVLEPEFRGSVGWGRKLVESSYKQWGRAMQDDLDDGMDYLAKQGTIDRKRACIMGASYGGYAVMMGLARNPERWRCGVNYVGVTDIQLMFDVTWSDFNDSDFIRYSAKEMIGDPDADAAMLAQVSPLQNAARVKAPVLMAYGGEDTRVPVVHGERMRDALLKQGTAVEWVVYQDEGHGFRREANRIDFYSRVAKFLGANLN